MVGAGQLITIMPRNLHNLVRARIITRTQDAAALGHFPAQVGKRIKEHGCFHLMDWK